MSKGKWTCLTFANLLLLSPFACSSNSEDRALPKPRSATQSTSTKLSEADFAALMGRIAPLVSKDIEIRELGGGRLEAHAEGLQHVLIGKTVAGGGTDVHCVSSLAEAEDFARGDNRLAEE